jgi:hypothetical protein
MVPKAVQRGSEMKPPSVTALRRSTSNCNLNKSDNNVASVHLQRRCLKIELLKDQQMRGASSLEPLPVGSARRPCLPHDLSTRDGLRRGRYAAAIEAR